MSGRGGGSRHWHDNRGPSRRGEGHYFSREGRQGHPHQTTPFPPHGGNNRHHSYHQHPSSARGEHRGGHGQNRHHQHPPPQRDHQWRNQPDSSNKRSRTNNLPPYSTTSSWVPKIEETPVQSESGATVKVEQLRQQVRTFDSIRVKEKSTASKPFAEMTRKEKLEHQYRWKLDWNNFPTEAADEESDGFIKKKVEASRWALKKVVEKMHEEALHNIANFSEDEGGDDWWDPYYSTGKSKEPKDHYPHTKKDITRFLDAAQECVFLTVGFDVFEIRPGDEDHCYCPCGPDMMNWQSEFKLEGLCANDDVKIERSKNPCARKKTPKGLMDHLGKLGETCTLHYALLIYLEHLYDKDTNHGHKAMYNINDSKWKQADARENGKMQKVKEQLMEERRKRIEAEKKMEEHRRQMELLKKVNEDRYNEIIKLEKTRKELGIKEKEEVSIDTEKLEVYRKGYHAFFDGIKNGMTSMLLPSSHLKKLPGLKKETDGPLEIQVGQKVDLQQFFDMWYEKSLKAREPYNATMLFHDLDVQLTSLEETNIIRNYYGYKIILDWNVQFTNAFKYGRTKAGREQKELDTAIDEGGPTREFLSQCWSQLGDLGVKVGDEKVLLFDRCPDGVQPQTDEFLKAKISSALQEGSSSEEYLTRARAYYCAVGRIMLHSLATRHTVSSSAVPPLYQNWLFRGCSPGDSDYHRDDVQKHLSGVGSNIALEYWKDIAEKESSREESPEQIIFSKLIPRHFLEPRASALCAIKEGLTLGGSFAISDIFRPMPLEGVQKLVFSSPLITAEAIIKILEPRYCEGFTGSDVEKVDQWKIQEDFFVRTLQEVLRDREQVGDDENFLSLFVYFCTGLNYLPDPDGNPNFKIHVDFNEMNQESLPMSHTCIQTLKLPGDLYSTRDEFESKLDEAVMSVKVMPFMMN